MYPCLSMQSHRTIIWNALRDRIQTSQTQSCRIDFEQKRLWSIELGSDRLLKCFRVLHHRYPEDVEQTLVLRLFFR